MSASSARSTSIGAIRYPHPPQRPVVGRRRGHQLPNRRGAHRHIEQPDVLLDVEVRIRLPRGLIGEAMGERGHRGEPARDLLPHLAQRRCRSAATEQHTEVHIAGIRGHPLHGQKGVGEQIGRGWTGQRHGLPRKRSSDETTARRPVHRVRTEIETPVPSTDSGTAPDPAQLSRDLPPRPATKLHATATGHPRQFSQPSTARKPFAPSGRAALCAGAPRPPPCRRGHARQERPRIATTRPR